MKRKSKLPSKIRVVLEFSEPKYDSEEESLVWNMTIRTQPKSLCVVDLLGFIRTAENKIQSLMVLDKGVEYVR